MQYKLWFEKLRKEEYAELIKEGTDDRTQILHQSS